jgi:DnaJ family protein C protein 28
MRDGEEAGVGERWYNREQRKHFQEESRMKFVDWRVPREQMGKEEQQPKQSKYRGKGYRDYVEEQIREAEARGAFANLPGAGKPLNLDENIYAGDRALAYHLLKSNGFAPAEVELAKEIRQERARLDAMLARLRARRKALRTRRVPPFASEKRAFNLAVEKAACDYEAALRDLNRKILTLNLSAPIPMHQSPLDVEQLVRKFREECPPFAL